ncbi:MAG: acyltransferase family protein, partial [Rhizomicrobium sp.]
ADGTATQSGGRSDRLQTGARPPDDDVCRSEPMNIAADRLTVGGAPRAAAAINNLRAIVVLMVIAVHGVLAYLASAAPRALPFDRPPFYWRTFPIIDAHRFIGFDIFCAWADVFLMPLFFLVSGFFVWQSLERRGALSFVRRRALRLAPPFLLGVALIIPFAIYPAYAERTAHPGIVDYWRHLLGLPFWPDGPMWFLWVLLIFDVATAGFFRLFPRGREIAIRLSSYARRNPIRYLAGFFAASALAYIPLGTAFGPMRWFQYGPFSFQLNFIALYAVYFAAGVVIGALGLERGVTSAAFARRWKRWAVAAGALFAAWLLVSAKTFTNPAASTGWMLADAVALVPACFASCIGVLLLTIHFGRVRTRALQSLQVSAFGMYWVHYPFVVWLQFALLGTNWPAVAKGLTVIVAAAGLSWATAVALRRLPVVSSVLGAGLRAPTPPPTAVWPALPLTD